MEALSKKITYGDKYGPAMEIRDQDRANEYFELLVQHCMSFGHKREKAEEIEKVNLGYWAGYYDESTRRRVESLFSCAHPVFGSIAKNGQPSFESAFAAGMTMARKDNV